MDGSIETVPAPFAAPVHGFATTRRGGCSPAPYDSLNLGAGCGDDRQAVARNRAILARLLPATPRWLQQVHGNDVIHADAWRPGVRADAAWTDRPGQVVAVLTADCLPILIAERSGGCIAAVHAGWRGLAAGVIEQAVDALPVAPAGLHAWIGPRIGAAAYTVGANVHAALGGLDPHAFTACDAEHWQADLAAIAGARLRRLGVAASDCGQCTVRDPARFYSYRRDGRCGRMATLAWLAATG